MDLQEEVMIQKKQQTLSLFPQLKIQGFDKTIDAVANLGSYQFGSDKSIDALVASNSLDSADTYNGFEFLLFFSDEDITLLLQDTIGFKNGITIWPTQIITKKFPQIKKLIPETNKQ
ncbi:hypothetical protein CXB49_07050 [Chromobacterium sp. ATCC 53434]|nr:hypothetical protein CXB49_07050 [Chromobacterium sp. ATCC 53434]